MITLLQLHLITIWGITDGHSSTQGTDGLVTDEITDKFHARTSSGAVYSTISVQRLEDLIVPRFFWLLLKLHASLYNMYGVPVSTWCFVIGWWWGQ